MSWIDDVDREFERAREAERKGNHGMVRTGARRAAGIAITRFEQMAGKTYGRDFIQQLRAVDEDASLPEAVRSAAHRLHSRLSADFQSLSEHPVEDARVIFEYVRELQIRSGEEHNRRERREEA
ncbi:MAG: hypothetical protein WBD36_01075 [Bacteroidota bacterium]